MAAAERQIKIVRSSPTSREEQRDKALFDSSMVIIRDLNRHCTHDSALYFLRQLKDECRELTRRFALKTVAD
jgi:hypothetical protein